MTIKKTALSTSLLTVAVMALSSPLFAQTEGVPEVKEGASNATIVDGDAVSIECITQAEVDAMTAEDKEKLTLPVCDDAKSNEADKKAEEKNAK